MKKKFNFKGAVLGAAILASGACVTAPAFLTTSVYAATEATAAAQATDRVVVTRTIKLYYKNSDGSVKPVKSTENKDLVVTRSAIFQSGDTTSTAELAGYDVPSIPGYIPDKTHIDSITVKSTSKPQDVVVYYTADPKSQKTYETETKTISRNITFYRVGDDGKAVQTYHKKQSATFTRNVIVYGDGRREPGAWQSYKFEGEDVPVVSGYTATLSAVPTVTATPDKPPQDVVVYYQKGDASVKDATDLTNFTVTFTDGLGRTLKTQTVGAGSSATAPKEPARTGYTFAGWDKAYTNVRGNIIVNAKWTQNKTEYITDSKSVRRTVSYFYSDGKPVIDINGKAAQEYYQHTFKRVGVKDTVTGKVTWGDWSPETTFPEVTPIAIQGYTPDRSKIASQRVSHGSTSWEIRVYYSKRDSVKNGIVSDAGIWKKYINGNIDTSFTGLAKAADGNVYYFKNGVNDKKHTNKLAKYSDSKWYFVKSGKVDKSFTGLGQSPDGRWYYVKKGVLDKSYSGLAISSANGKWYYVSKGLLNKKYTNKLVKSPINGKWYFVKNGQLDKSFTGLGQSPNGRWYFVRNGILDKSYTGLAVSSLDGRLYFAQNGILNKKYSGKAVYNGKTYTVTNGIAKPV